MRVEINGEERALSGRQLRVLFARLVLAGEAPVARDDLIASLWAGQRPGDAPAILRTLLSRLRAAIGAGAVTGRVAVRLALPEPVRIDIEDAEQAVITTQRALDEHDFLTALRSSQAALDVLRRELLPGERGEWLEQRRRRVEEARLEALECEALAGSQLGGAARACAVRAGRELVERAPFRESGYAALMQAHAACGNVAEAIRLYIEMRDLLRRELGAVPGQAIVELYEQLLAGDARRSAASVAFEAAPELLRRAFDAVEGVESADPSLRCELLLELGSSLEREGEHERARDVFAEAATLARKLRRADLLGIAAIGYGGRGIPFAPGVADPPLVALLEEATAALGDAQTPLMVRLLAITATVTAGPPVLHRRAALSESAVALARQLGDPGSLALALSARHLATWGPDNLDQRRADAIELIGLLDAGADREAVLPGHLWLFTDRLEAGDVEGADRQLSAYGRIAGELGHSGYLWWEALLRAMRHFMAGRFKDAEHCAERVLALAPRPHDAVVAQLVTVQVLAVRKEAGELSTLEAMVKETIERYPDVAAWRCFLAYLYAETNQLDAARREFAPLVAQLDSFARDHLWLISLALLADVCAVVGDASAAAVLYPQLLPYASRMVVGLGGLWFGPVEHHLALLARTARDFKAAEQHFYNAAASNRAIGARPWLGHTLREWAAALAMRGSNGDRQRGGTLLDEAGAIAEALDMVDLRRAVESVRASLVAADTRPTGRARAAATA